jgi:DNA-binding transcriptional ArsR family regulator
MIIHNNMVVDILSVTFAALSHPRRRAIIDTLARGPRPVHALHEKVKISQQAISKHLACLEHARIIAKRKVGRESVYRLLPRAIDPISEWMWQCRSYWEENFDRLEDVLEDMKQEAQDREIKGLK